MHCKYALVSLVNKRADWQIARQEKDRRDLQTKREHGQEWRSHGSYQPHAEEPVDEHAVLKKGRA